MKGGRSTLSAVLIFAKRFIRGSSPRASRRIALKSAVFTEARSPVVRRGASSLTGAVGVTAVEVTDLAGEVGRPRGNFNRGLQCGARVGVEVAQAGGDEPEFELLAHVAGGAALLEDRKAGSADVDADERLPAERFDERDAALERAEQAVAPRAGVLGADAGDGCGRVPVGGETELRGHEEAHRRGADEAGDEAVRGALVELL